MRAHTFTYYPNRPTGRTPCLSLERALSVGVLVSFDNKDSVWLNSCSSKCKNSLVIVQIHALFNAYLSLSTDTLTWKDHVNILWFQTKYIWVVDKTFEGVLFGFGKHELNFKDQTSNHLIEKIMKINQPLTTSLPRDACNKLWLEPLLHILVNIPDLLPFVFSASSSVTCGFIDHRSERDHTRYFSDQQKKGLS